MLICLLCGTSHSSHLQESYFSSISHKQFNRNACPGTVDWADTEFTMSPSTRGVM